MANPEHLAKLKEGVEAWNQWRDENPATKANLRGADLHEADLTDANLREADLTDANLREADLTDANLREAHLFRAYLRGAHLHRADLEEANLTRADLFGADLRGAHLFGAHLRGGADLREAKLSGADLREADLFGADLRGANLMGADLSDTNLHRADLKGADLTRARLGRANLVKTNLKAANLTECHVYGISAWDVELEGAIQANLVITPENQSAIQVDNLQVAQFVYLLLNNESIRDVIDTITSKVVLILGRFTPERKAVLDAIREELRKRKYLPVLFDFQKPERKDLTGTVTTLANMARFIIVDLTDPRCVPYELAMIVPNTFVPVQTLLEDGQQEFAMFADLKRRFHWVLEPYRYESQDSLLQHLEDGVIRPAEAKATELISK